MRVLSFAKFALLGALLLFFAIALFNVGLIVDERKNYRDQVIAEVASGSADRQRVLGPVLVTSGEPADSGAAARRARIQAVLLPETLLVTSSAEVEVRHRGIHKAQVFHSHHRITAIFHVPPHMDIDPAKLAGEPVATWVFGVTDLRGLRKPPVVRANGVPLAVTPGSGQRWIPQGFTAVAEGVSASEPRRWVIEADLDLVGTNRLAFVPIGGVTRIDLGANWPHPSFDGTFLPDERTIDARSFRARWELSRFATGVDDALARWRARGDDGGKEGIDVGVTFLEPVDVYQKSERATKYGMLFVLLTFVAFFLFETLKGLSLHPLHYGLAGSALAIFFLLLLSLSEHMPFMAAYVVAAGACVGLLTYYMSSVLGGRTRGLAFGGMLACLYALLFVILSSIDYALLLGSLLLFGVLAFVMVTTRRVDWFRIGEKAAAGPAPPPRPPA